MAAEARDVGSFICTSLAARSFALRRAADALAKPLSVDLAQTHAAARPAMAAALWRMLRGQMIVWTATVDAADRLSGDCACYLADAGAPVWTLRPRDDSAGAASNPSGRSARLETMAALARQVPGVFIVPHAALRQPVMPRPLFLALARTLNAGREYGWESLLRDLVQLGYERAPTVSSVGEFAVRGGLIDLFPATADAPVRLEFFGDTLESIRSFGLVDQRSTGRLEATFLAPWRETADDAAASILSYAPDAVTVVDDPEMIFAVDRSLDARRDEHTVAAADADTSDLVEVDLGRPDLGRPDLGRPLQLAVLAEQLRDRPVATFIGAIATERISRKPDLEIAAPSELAPAYGRSIENFVDDVRRRTAKGELVAVISVAHRRVHEVLAEHGIAVPDAPDARLMVGDGVIDEGFSFPELRLTVVCDAELFGHPARRHKIKAIKESVPASEADLVAGEFFVHAHHGIGRFAGLERLVINDAGRDFLVLLYAGNDRLYVPVDQMHLVRKYLAADTAPPRISRMGGTDWARTRSRVKEAVDKIAEGLVKLYAAREAAEGHAFAPDTPWQAELEESFPYDETPDQRIAIDAIKGDMERPRPMDRLVCGDVGYGKTEVAIRAAFKAIMDRKQVAVLAPTTVLAAQHFRTFTERFAAFPVTLGLLSRLRPKAEQRATLERSVDGSLDLIIGTHRLLQKDVSFARLGLVIVDEEQRFGVAHKERLKELRKSVDVLTLSATPIPRTLHMAMAGLRDLSLIQTPPENRIAVKTVVTPTSDALIGSAISQELERGGQVYFVHNRIETIHGVAAAVQRLAPRARIRIGHGQMPGPELEELMVGFVNGEFDVLVSTTIIENGLDIPNVNTIVVNNADRFGLAQLYQLRGRVGRSAHQAYAYLLYQPHRAMTEAARARLDAIREFSHLGSGLRLAMRDLEIRGAGNLLGRDQSGFIASVGFDEYVRILHEAVARQSGEPAEVAEAPPTIDLRRDAFIPDDYVGGSQERISLYQRLAAARAVADVDAIADELRDRFGPLPVEALTLLDVARLRVVATTKGVQKLSLEGRRLTLEVGRRFSLSEQALAALKSITRGNFRFTHSAVIAQLPDGVAEGSEPMRAVREIVAAL